MISDPKHECAFREEARRLSDELSEVRQELAVIKRQLLGRKSEKMPSMSSEVRKKRPVEPEVAQRRRRENAAAKEKLETEIVPVAVPADARHCTKCGNEHLKAVGHGTPSVVYEYVAAHFRRRIYQRETLACRCGETIVTAPCPERFADRCSYAPSFIAHLLVEKCEDGIPLYRLEKQYARLGIPIARSTMTDLFHRAAERLAPLAQRVLARVASSEIVFADETPIKMQGTTKRAFMWAFLAENLIGFEFSPNRSGDVPFRVLGDSKGELMVDMYTGYNKVVAPGTRRRAGCLAHARRKIFDAKEIPGAQEGLDIIRDIYVIEHDARESGIESTDKHLEQRRIHSRPLIARLLAWARRLKREHPPKSPLGKAVRYILRNRKPLTRFLYVAALPPDNNRSERALRRVALGRKNWLFVGHENAGKNIAGLLSLIASCVANNVNPVAYLTDVLIRVDTHPNRDIDDLLPDRWQNPS